MVPPVRVNDGAWQTTVEDWGNLMSSGMFENGAPLSERLIEYYVGMLAAHKNAPITGVCRICKYARCRDWQHAYERLVVAGIPANQQAKP
jgi:hypothetical protein